MADTKPNPDVKSGAAQRMEPMLQMVDDLRGTEEMRSAETRWLPLEDKEEPQSYSTRLSRSFLYPGYRDTVRRVVAAPYSEETRTQGKPGHDQLELMLNEFDDEGNDLTAAGKKMFTRGVNYGGSFYLVDAPATGGGLNLQQEQDLGIHPYVTHYHPNQFLGAQFVKRPFGKSFLGRVRFMETMVQHASAPGRFEEKEEIQVREIVAPNVEGNATGLWRIWRKPAGAEIWAVAEEGTHTYPGIPLGVFVTESTGMMEFAPPMLDLAWVNVAHWQSYSDQRNLLRYARVAMLLLKGVSKKEMDEIIVAGLNAVRTDNEQADGKFIEHHGHAIGAGRQDLMDLIEIMVMLGSQPWLTNSGNETATAKAIDEGKQVTNIQQWVRGAEMHLLNAVHMANVWVKGENATLPEDFQIDIPFKGMSQENIERGKLYLEARKAKEITREQFYAEWKKLGLMDQEVDVDQAVEDLENETSLDLEGAIRDVERERQEVTSGAA